MIRCKILIPLCIACSTFGAFSQGPPLTADKPIMLAGGASIFKTLTEVRSTNEGTFVRAPLMAHYLPTSNILVAVHLPYVSYAFTDASGRGSGTTLGDINILGKYQFYRKDATAKTFRIVAKTLQTLPTGKALDIEDFSTGDYAGYYGFVAGYESLKFGISSEIGYKWVPNGTLDVFQQKLGFGLPLLKPTYPVNQLNLYFEYASEWLVSRNEYVLKYAQGIQYARKKWTWEAGIQLPLVQDAPKAEAFNYALFIGARFIL
ncbi:MAG: hypothetical protein ACPG7E_01475 [Marinirhabdus sp.]